jgi:hypothetical protein
MLAPAGLGAGRGMVHGVVGAELWTNDLEEAPKAGERRSRDRDGGPCVNMDQSFSLDLWAFATASAECNCGSASASWDPGTDTTSGHIFRNRWTRSSFVPPKFEHYDYELFSILRIFLWFSRR